MSTLPLPLRLGTFVVPLIVLLACAPAAAPAPASAPVSPAAAKPAAQSAPAPAAKPAAPATVRITAIPPYSTNTWPVLIADRQGYLRSEAIEVKSTYTFGGGPLLAGGQVDLIMDGPDSTLSIAEQGGDAFYAAPISTGITIGMLGAKPITRLADLEGKSFMISASGSTDEFIVKRYLVAQGIALERIQFVPNRDEGAGLAQMRTGQIAAGKFTPEKILAAERSGEFNVLVQASELGMFPWVTIQTTHAYANQNRDALVRFLRAVERGKQFILDPANKDAVIKDVVAAASGLETSTVELGYDAAGGFGHFSSRPLTVDDLQPALEFIAFQGRDPARIDLSKLLDNSIYEQALR